MRVRALGRARVRAPVPASGSSPAPAPAPAPAPTHRVRVCMHDRVQVHVSGRVSGRQLNVLYRKLARYLSPRLSFKYRWQLLHGCGTLSRTLSSDYHKLFPPSVDVIHVCVFVCACVWMLHTRTHTHAHKHTHTHTHTHIAEQTSYPFHISLSCLPPSHTHTCIKSKLQKGLKRTREGGGGVVSPKPIDEEKILGKYSLPPPPLQGALL